MRPDLPSGTVTFLFTDVEGSTRLLHELGAEGYAEALAEHRRVIRDACTRHSGVEVDTQGDAFFLAFPTEPPRALDGFVDTLSEVSGFDLEHPFLVRLYNPVAAMPSLHVAFAVVTGTAIAERARTRPVKTAAYLYPALVTAVVAATGNHYVLDAAVGAALGAAARLTP